MKKIVFTLAILFALFAGTASTQSAPASANAPELKIGGAVQTSLTLTSADLKKMPRKTLSVVNPHSQKKETYEGVPLSEKEGPFKIVAPHEKRPARWVRMLKSITVVHAQ